MKTQKPILKFFVLALGFTSLILGIIGIVVPILPTTPFILLSAFLFLHSSKKLHNWLHENKFFGKYLKSYREGNGIPLKMKIFFLIILNTSILYSVFYVVSNIWVNAVLIVIAISVSIHIFMIKTNKNI